jgi:5-methylcytosine-specific restriction endonuclease McrA
MMDSSNIQYYKEQLIEYLKSTKRYRNTDNTKVQKIVDAIEFDLLKVIQTNLNDNLQVIYDFLDKDALEELINETNRGRSLFAQNELSGGLLRDAIHFYLGYLGSKKHPLSEKEKKGGKKKTPKESAPPQKVPVAEAKPVISEPEPFDKLEGKKYETAVTKYERNQGNRKLCIAHYGYVCKVCEINFEQAYGDLGKDFIEVHHLHPVSQGERNVNPIEDLIPLCSNCHSMIHRQEDVSDWEGLREKYLKYKQND